MYLVGAKTFQMELYTFIVTMQITICIDKKLQDNFSGIHSYFRLYLDFIEIHIFINTRQITDYIIYLFCFVTGNSSIPLPTVFSSYSSSSSFYNSSSCSCWHKVWWLDSPPHYVASLWLDYPSSPSSSPCSSSSSSSNPPPPPVCLFSPPPPVEQFHSTVRKWRKQEFIKWKTQDALFIAIHDT